MQRIFIVTFKALNNGLASVLEELKENIRQNFRYTCHLHRVVSLYNNTRCL